MTNNGKQHGKERIIMNKKYFLVVLSLVATIITYATDKNVVLFEAGKSPVKTFYCSTCKWIKGSDLCAKPVLTTVDNEKWLKFNYTGSKGSSRAIILLKDILKKLPKDVTPRGITFTILYPEKGFGKLPVTLSFADGNAMAKHLPLEHGTKEYFFETGWTRKKVNPKDWRGLTSISITVPANKIPDFYIKSIAIKLHERKTVAKKLAILKVRKIQEILPGKGASSLTFGTNSPLKAKIGYDKNNLYVDTYAEYPGKPASLFKPGDKVGTVWADELTEYFFDGWNDNRCFVQFVTNLNGAVWDSITAFDKTAASVIRKVKDWSLKHQKNMSFADGVWKTEAVFPFSEYNFDLKRQFMGFQIAQGYSTKRGGKFKPAYWAPCTRLPYPRNFGLLVFNKKPFGSGSVKVDEVVANKDEASGNADFVLNCTLSDFSPGKYILKKYIASPDETFQEMGSEKLSLSGKATKHTVTLPGVKSLDGIYTFYLGIINQSGDMRLCAVNVENIVPLQNKFGQRIFCPDPKQLKWGKGVFNIGGDSTISVSGNASARTMLTAKILAKKILDFTGSKYKIVKGGNNGIILGKDEKVIPAKVKSKLRGDGYKLSVSTQKIAITGGGEAGLYYGCMTLMQLIKQPMKRTVESPVPVVEIVDYPDLPIRFVNLLHPWQFFKGAFKERRSIDYLIDWVDRYVAATKLNLFICNIDSIVKYKRHPEFNEANCLYSMDDMAKLAKYCRDNFIEFVPRWQIGGHASWWLLRVHPEFREKGYRDQADVSNPKHNKIVFDCFLDLIEATKCKYINVGGDEWWHSSKGEKPDAVLPSGKTRAEAFLEFFQEAAKFGRKHNVKILTHEDMINPYHNGTRYDVYKVADKLPKKDIIVLPWSCKDQGIEYFNKKGFTQWPNPTGVWFPKKTIPMIEGFGVSVYTFFYALPLTGPKVVPSYITNLLRGSEFAWNAKTDEGTNLIAEIGSGKLPALVNMFALSADPAGSPKVAPLSLQDKYNSNFNGLISKVINRGYEVSIKDGTQSVGNIPMTLKATGSNCVRIKRNSHVSIPVNGKYASLIFLHSVLTTDEYLNANSRKLLWRHWIYGRPAGDYNVVYQDGSKVKLPLRLDDNIGKAVINPLFRTSIGCRYILPLKTFDGNNVFLYQWEWVNPHPDKKITGIELTQSVVDFDLLLFAVSGRFSTGR